MKIDIKWDINIQGSSVKHYQLFSILAISISAVGCAVTSGLQTYDIPEQGLYTTELGSQVNVIKITQENLVATLPASIDYKKIICHCFISSKAPTA